MEKHERRKASWVCGVSVLVALSLLGCGTSTENAGGTGGKRTAQNGASPAKGGAAADALPVADISAKPGDYFDTPTYGTAAVAEVMSNRGFMVEQDGKRMLVVKDPSIAEAVEIKAGQQVRIEGSVYDPAQMSSVPGMADIEQKIQDALKGQPAYVYATKIETVGS